MWYTYTAGVWSNRAVSQWLSHKYGEYHVCWWLGNINIRTSTRHDVHQVSRESRELQWKIRPYVHRGCIQICLPARRCRTLKMPLNFDIKRWSSGKNVYKRKIFRWHHFTKLMIPENTLRSTSRRATFGLGMCEKINSVPKIPMLARKRTVEMIWPEKCIGLFLTYTTASFYLT